jgi:aminopeptidase-like protein
MAESLTAYLSVINVLEGNKVYMNLNPKGEVRLGKHGLYRTVGGQIAQPLNELALLWVLNLSDGQSSLLNIAEKANLPFHIINEATQKLLSHGLVAEQVRFQNCQ